MNIVYEDSDLLILHKPSGMPSAPRRPGEGLTEKATAVDWVRSRCSALEGVPECGLLHRLDTLTSGLLAFAKSREEYDRLRQAWKQRLVQKFYRAWITASDRGVARGFLPKSGDLPKLPFTIDFPLAHSAKSSKRMICLLPKARRSQIRGKPLEAVTHLLRIHQTLDRRAQAVYDLEIQIETGVMHQIRCHLSALGWPILGDPIYKGEPSTRLWLHAWRLRLPLKSGAHLTVEATWNR